MTKIVSKWVLDSSNEQLDLIAQRFYCAQRKFRDGQLWVLMSKRVGG